MMMLNSPRQRTVAAAAAVLVFLTGASGCSIGREKPPKSSRATAPSTSPPAPTVTDPSAPAPVAHGSMSPFGAHWDPSRTSLFETYLATIPHTYTYFEMTWCKVEKEPGAINWRPVDKAVDFGNRMKIETMLKIRVGSCWATSKDATKTRGRANKTESNMPDDMAAYTDFVTQVVKRYSALGVREFAIENEVNSPSYWGGTPAEFVSLVKAASAAIRAADSSAKVVDPGLSSTTYGYGIAKSIVASGDVDGATAAWNSYYQSRSGTRGEQLVQVTSQADLQKQLDSEQGRRNLAYLDVVSKLARDGVVDVRQVHFYETADSIPLLTRFLADSTPPDVPVEIWEAGIFKEGGGDQTESKEQADEMLRIVSALLGGGATKVIWLPLAAQPDSRKGEEVRGGLLSPQGEDRQIGHIMTDLVAASTGAEIKAPSAESVRGVGFIRDESSTLVLWSDGSGATVNLGSGADVTDPFTGQTTTQDVAQLTPQPKVITVSGGEAERLLR